MRGITPEILIPPVPALGTPSALFESLLPSPLTIPRPDQGGKSSPPQPWIGYQTPIYSSCVIDFFYQVWIPPLFLFPDIPSVPLPQFRPLRRAPSRSRDSPNNSQMINGNVLLFLVSGSPSSASRITRRKSNFLSSATPARAFHLAFFYQPRSRVGALYFAATATFFRALSSKQWLFPERKVFGLHAPCSGLRTGCFFGKLPMKCIAFLSFPLSSDRHTPCSCSRHQRFFFTLSTAVSPSSPSLLSPMPLRVPASFLIGDHYVATAIPPATHFLSWLQNANCSPSPSPSYIRRCSVGISDPDRDNPPFGPNNSAPNSFFFLFGTPKLEYLTCRRTFPALHRNRIGKGAFFFISKLAKPLSASVTFFFLNAR